MARTSGRYVTAALFILLGLALLLFTTGYANWTTVWDVAVPAFLVLLGLWALLASSFRNLTGPVMVVAIAGVVLLRNLGVIPAGYVNRYWPLFLVLFGLLIFLNHQRRQRHAEGADVEDVTAVSIFGGADRRVTSQHFTGGEVVAIFGGPDIDLRDAAVDHPPATIEIVSVFGGADIVVPEGWDVDLETLPIFGGATDSRTHGTPKETPDLVVTGISVFGGVEVRD